MGIKRFIEITCTNDEDKVEIGKKIHDQLVGNQDYIDCSIILNIDEPNMVRLWIYDDIRDIPEILI